MTRQEAIRNLLQSQEFLGNTGGGLLNFSAPQVAATTQGTP